MLPTATFSDYMKNSRTWCAAAMSEKEGERRMNQ